MTAAAICTNLTPRKKKSPFSARGRRKKSCFPILLYSFFFHLRIKPAFFSQKLSSSVPIFCVTRFWDRSAKTKKAHFSGGGTARTISGGFVMRKEKEEEETAETKKKERDYEHSHNTRTSGILTEYCKISAIGDTFLLPSFWSRHPLRLCPPLRDGRHCPLISPTS